MPRWTEQDVPPQDGRIVVVTGANSGLGFHTARVLAARGAHVVLASRSADKAADAMALIRVDTPGADLDVLPLDLADLASVRAFAQRFADAHDRLDVLVNNAGVMATPYRRTADGFELQLGTNHLGHFALTGLLLPSLLAAPAPRVVTVSSGAHQMGRIDFDDLQGERRYRTWPAYGQSKLANLLFAYELARRVGAAGLPLVSAAAHPGYSATNLQAVGPRMSGAGLTERLAAIGNRLLAQDAARGALPQLYAATMPDVRSGDYYGPDGLLEMRGWPEQVSSSARSKDEAVARRLWHVSEELTGVRYDALDASS
ncbi:MAG: SDR family oxidoreductase [Acidimicrobiales bacterium]|nr:SDR family oxidoreductase [Acidimicrobiales bacterium]